jgi:hypothetical protein
MPLRDHQTSRDAVLPMWPAMIVMQLNPHLPHHYAAGPIIGSESEVGINPFEVVEIVGAIWQPPEPCLRIETELLAADIFEVRVYDIKHHRRLVAVIEIVSPSNKDRPESRHSFTAKCEALLRQGVSVSIVDIISSKHFNLYTDLLDLIGQSDSSFVAEPSAIYAASLRWVPRGRKHILETWSHVLQVGSRLPTLPLWLAENIAIPLELDLSYEQTCRALRIA